MFSHLRNLLPDIRRRIAVTGLYNSGKTVFLTSLLSHLTNHSKEFSLDGNGSDWKFTKLDVPRGKHAFPHGEYHRRLIENGEFPAKTNATSQFHAVIRPGAGKRRYRIELIDCPGERFADAGMYGTSYTDWADRLIRHWQVANPTPVRNYIEACNRENADYNAVVNAYRLLLATKLTNCEPMITPSTFKLPESGQGLKGRSVEAILGQSPLCGIRSGCEFAPLPKDVQLRKGHLSKEMARNYDLYRRKIVNPFFSDLSWCDRLIILIDIPSLLAAGASAINDNQDLLRIILEKLKPSERSSVRAATWWIGGIQKVAFVATKSDLVCEDDVERLDSLLQQMVLPLRIMPDYVKQGFFVVSSVVSTSEPNNRQPTSDSAWLTGRLTRDYSTSPPKPVKRADAVETDFEITRLPVGWPKSFSNGMFAFPEVYPRVPETQFLPPDQNDLDAVFKFVVT